MTSRCEFVRGAWRCTKAARQTLLRIVNGRTYAAMCCTPHARMMAQASDDEIRRGVRRFVETYAEEAAL